MDYSTLRVYVYPIGEGDNIHYEDLIATFGFKLSQINWMVADSFNLEIH